MPAPLAEVAARRLAAIAERERFRRRQPLTGAGAARVDADGRDLRVFCSNDYLGLAADPRLVSAMQDAAAEYGAGSGASAYVSGYCPEQAALEAELADFLGRDRALVFGAGYLANPGVIDALVGRGDEIWSDALNHASLIDGCRLSGATTHTYPHIDPEGLDAQQAQAGQGNRLIVTDSVFSMDGDRAPLEQLATLAHRHQAWLMVDDAHGFGLDGDRGAGAAERLGQEDLPVLSATLGKAIGVYGAFVAGSEELIELLVQTARSAIFTTALPPALLAAARAGLRLAREEGWRREALAARIAQFRSGLVARGLPASSSLTPIQPLIVGDEARALALSAALREAGYWVGAIRPPTVPAGTARLRITLSAAHKHSELEGLLDALAQAWASICAPAA